MDTSGGTPPAAAMASWFSRLEARCQRHLAACSCASTEDLLMIAINGGIPPDLEMSACKRAGRRQSAVSVIGEHLQ